MKESLDDIMVKAKLSESLNTLKGGFNLFKSDLKNNKLKDVYYMKEGDIYNNVTYRYLSKLEKLLKKRGYSKIAEAGEGSFIRKETIMFTNKHYKILIEYKIIHEGNLFYHVHINIKTEEISS